MKAQFSYVIKCDCGEKELTIGTIQDNEVEKNPTMFKCQKCGVLFKKKKRIKKKFDEQNNIIPTDIITEYN
jgi:predicted SprT family Zn-dependent metalloprotease